MRRSFAGVRLPHQPACRPGAHPPRRRLKVAASAAPGPLNHGQAAARPFSLDSRQAQVSVRRNEDTVGLTHTRRDGCFLGRGNVRTQPTTSLKPKEMLTCRNVSCEHLSLADCEHFYIVYVQIVAAAPSRKSGVPQKDDSRIGGGGGGTAVAGLVHALRGYGIG